MKLATGFLTGVMVGTLFIVSPVNSEAQTEDAAGFAVTIGSQIISGRPGQTVTSSLSIIATNTRETTRYEITPMDLGANKSGMTLPVEQGTGARSCAKWVAIPGSVEVQPGGSRNVSFTINIPPDAKANYYAYIKVGLVTERPKDAKAVVMINPSLAVRVEIQIPGPIERELGVTDLSYMKVPESGKPVMLLEILNEGNIKSSLEGDVLLYGQKGTFPYRALIPMDESGKPFVIYPELTKTMQCAFITPPPPGTYEAQVRLRIERRWRTKSMFDIEIPSKDKGRAVSAESRARMESDIALQVEPEYVEVTLPSGAKRSVSMRVQNKDTAQVSVQLSVVKIVQEMNGFLTYADLPDTEHQWLDVTSSEFKLKAHSTRNVMLHIQAPDDETIMDEEFAVRVIGTAGEDETGWLSQVEHGVPVIQVPPGAPPPNIEIEEFRIIRMAPNQNPTAAVLVIQNRGGRTAKLEGSIDLERAFTGEEIQRMILSDQEGVILPPGIVREFRMSITYLDRDEFRITAEVSEVDQPKKKKTAEVRFTCTKGPS